MPLDGGPSNEAALLSDRGYGGELLLCLAGGKALLHPREEDSGFLLLRVGEQGTWDI